MNMIDVVILVAVGIFAVRGIIRGVLMEVFTLLGLLIGYLIALRQMSAFGALIQKGINLNPPIPGIVAFVVIFLLIITGFRLIAGLLRKFMKWTLLGWLDKGLGGLFGLFKGVLIASLIILLFMIILPTDTIKKTDERSILFGPVRAVAPAVFNVIKYTFPKTRDFYEEVKEGVSESSDKVKEEIIKRQLDSPQESEREDGLRN